MLGIDRSLVMRYKNCSCWGTFHWLQVFYVKPFVTVPFLVIFINMLYCILGSTYRALPVREEQGMKQAFAASYSGCQGAEFVLNRLTKYWKKTSATLSQYFISYRNMSALSTQTQITEVLHLSCISCFWKRESKVVWKLNS